jgi:hypothetical protein
MVALLDIVVQFNVWSGISLNVGKCKIAAYIQGLQPNRKKTCKDEAVRARLAHILIGGHQIGALSQYELLPGGYLGKILIASLCLDAHLRWTKQHLDLIRRAVNRALHPSRIKQRLLIYGVQFKINHTHCLMALFPSTMAEVDSIVEGVTIQIWHLPNNFPREGLHAPLEELGLNIPTF